MAANPNANAVVQPIAGIPRVAVRMPRQPRAPRNPYIQGAADGADGAPSLGFRSDEVVIKNEFRNVVKTSKEEHWIDDNNKKRKSIDKTVDDRSQVQRRKYTRVTKLP